MYSLAIHMDGQEFKVALLHLHKKKISIPLLRSFPLDVKPLYILQSVLAGKQVVVVTGLDTDEMVVRETDFKLKKKAERLNALPFQVESLIPYPADETVVKPFFHESSTTIFATSQSLIQAHLTRMEKSEIDPDQISCVPAALARWVELLFPNISSACLIHQGGAKDRAVFLSKGQVRLSQALEPSVKERDRLALFIKSKFPDLLADQITPDTVSAVKIDDWSTQDLYAYAVPIGLALDGLYRDRKTVQWRQSSLLSKKQNKALLTSSLVFIAACLTLSLISWIGADYFLHKREKQLHLTLDSYTALQGQSSSLKERYRKWENSLQGTKQGFPYIPSAPTVSDFLAWLSTQSAQINLSRLHYSLVKYPKLGETSEPYQAKVELEFTVVSPRTAREFHDALLSDAQIIDSKQQVEWTVRHHDYQTSFTLRNR